MPKEKYMVIDPSGDVRWIEIDRLNLLEEFYEVIDCDCLENFRTIIPDVCLIVDESGRIKDPPKPHNDLASHLYLGWILGNDDIVGSAIVAAIHLVDGDPDWVPLNDIELFKVQNYLGIL